jgi:hypothetical protein
LNKDTVVHFVLEYGNRSVKSEEPKEKNKNPTNSQANLMEPFVSASVERQTL